MTLRDARKWLYRRGWSASARTMESAFPDGPPVTVQALQVWAEHNLPPPAQTPRRHGRAPGLSLEQAAEALRGAGYNVPPGRIGAAMRTGAIRLARDGRLIGDELRCWARRMTP